MSIPLDVNAASLQRPASDQLIAIADIRKIFGLGRTAAYDLTRRLDFPGHVRVSSRCYRWWASEVQAYAEALRSDRARPAPQQAVKPQLSSTAVPLRISGKVRTARVSRTAK
jgi:predicted DNA-binding transcriptional regulator AlpA